MGCPTTAPSTWPSTFRVSSLASGATVSPAPPRTVYRYSEANDALLASYTAAVAPRARCVSNRLRAEVATISVDATSHLFTGIIDDVQGASAGLMQNSQDSQGPRGAPFTNGKNPVPRTALPETQQGTYPQELQALRAFFSLSLPH